MRQLFFTVVFLSQSYLSAQEYIPITKTEVLEKVNDANYSIRINESKNQIAEADFKQTKALFLPQVSVSYTGIQTNNPLMAFGSKLNQEILTQADFNPTLLNNPDKTISFATKIEIQQPLINVDGYYKREAARTKIQATHLESIRTKEYLEFEVDKAYMQLQLAHKAIDVVEQALQTAYANKKIAENKMKQGYMQKSDMLAVEVRVTEIKNQLFSAKSNVQNASDYVSYLMNTKEEVVYVPSEELSIERNDVSDVTVSPERSDLKAMQLATLAYQKMYKSDKMSFLPRLNAFANVQLYDDKIFQADASGYVVGVNLSWDILKGTQRFGKLQKSEANVEKSKLEYEEHLSKANLELNKAKRMLSDASHQLELTALAVDQSKEVLRIRKNRFKEGLEKSADLLTAETQYAQKQLEYYKTIYQYNFAKSYVKFLTKK